MLSPVMHTWYTKRLDALSRFTPGVDWRRNGHRELWFHVCSVAQGLRDNSEKKNSTVSRFWCRRVLRDRGCTFETEISTTARMRAPWMHTISRGISQVRLRPRLRRSRRKWTAHTDSWIMGDSRNFKFFVREMLNITGTQVTDEYHIPTSRYSIRLHINGTGWPHKGTEPPAFRA